MLAALAGQFLYKFFAMWQHPWLRIQLLLRSMLGARWDATTWPTIKGELKKAPEMRSRIQRARGSFN